MTDLEEEVTASLRAAAATDGAARLCEEIFAKFDEGGPDAVEHLLEQKVKAIRKSAKAEATEMRAAAGAVQRRGRSKRR